MAKRLAFVKTEESNMDGCAVNVDGGITYLKIHRMRNSLPLKRRCKIIWSKSATRATEPHTFGESV